MRPNHTFEHDWAITLAEYVLFPNFDGRFLQSAEVLLLSVDFNFACLFEVALLKNGHFFYSPLLTSKILNEFKCSHVNKDLPLQSGKFRSCEAVYPIRIACRYMQFVRKSWDNVRVQIQATYMFDFSVSKSAYSIQRRLISRLMLSAYIARITCDTKENQQIYQIA